MKDNKGIHPILYHFFYIIHKFPKTIWFGISYSIFKDVIRALWFTEGFNVFIMPD